MSIVSFDVDTPKNTALKAKELALELFSYENFLLIAVQSVRLKEKNLKKLNTSTAKAIHSLASLLPPPQTLWEEFATTLLYPMPMRLEEIKNLERDLLKISETKPFKVADLRTKERQLKAKTSELKIHIFQKEKQKQKLLQLTTQLLLNTDNRAQMIPALRAIGVSKARAKKYDWVQSGAQELLEIATWMGNGPFPFSPIGQLIAPIPLVIAQFSFTNSNRNNPSKIPPKLSPKLDTAGAIAGVSAVIISLVATTSTPFLPVVAAGAILINSITGTVTVFQNYKKAKTIVETPAGKKIRMKGHITDIIGNVAGAIASTGILGMTIAATIGVTTIILPPATLVLLSTLGFGVSIAALALSAAAYFKKTELLKQANNQKLLFDFENACEHGVLNDLSFSFDDKKIRSVATARSKSKPMPLLAVFSGSTSPSGHIVHTLDEQHTVTQFERVLAMGFIPELIDHSQKNITLTPNTHIQITQHSPPDPKAAIEAIQKIGCIPTFKFSDPKEQAKMLKAYSSEQPNNSKTDIPSTLQDLDAEPPLLRFKESSTIGKATTNKAPQASTQQNKKP
jgi:DNA-binding protein H-NS